MSYVVYSPFTYRERFCLYGYAGVGKSSTILAILAASDPSVEAYVIDLDYSYSYQRLIAAEYPELESRVHIFQIDKDLEELKQVWSGEYPAEDKVLWTQADPAKDWIVIDPTTATWSMVQDWWIDKAFGDDIGTHMAELRIEAKARVEAGKKTTKSGTEDSEYSASVAQDMQWPIINKLYDKHFYRQLHKWRGHMILVCEADGVRNDAKEEERALYGFIGHKPKGQKSLPFVAATNIYLDHPSAATYRMTTAKDRGRALMDKVPVENFAFDYLVNVAGWGWVEYDDETGEEVARS